ncbi:hypothetical protein Tco_0454411 [Tanacetum coccineum]
MSNNSKTDSEISLSVFYVRSSDEESTPANDRFSKADGYHAVPPPITGNFLTPRADISFKGFDEYTIRKKITESKTTSLNTKTSETVVLTRAGLVNTDRSNVSTARSIRTVRPVSTARSIRTDRPVSTTRPLASKIALSNNVIRPNHQRLDIVRPKASNSPIKRSYFTQQVYRPKDLKPDVKTFKVKNMTTVGTRAVVSKGKVENVLKKAKWGNPEILLQDHAVVDSGCSSHMTSNKAYLSDYEDFNGGFVAFGSDPKGGKIIGKGKIKTANLDFDDVYFVDELNFKLLDESQVILRAPRKDDVYSLDLNNIFPSGGHLVRGLPLKVFVNDHTCVACKKGKQKESSESP